MKDENSNDNLLKDWYEENLALVTGDFSEIKARIRSTFLDRFLLIENIVETLIATELFPTESEGRTKVLSCILNVEELTFSSKVDILHNLLKNRSDKILNKYPDLFPKISRIRKLRNRFAHSLFDNLWDISMGRIYKDKIKMEFFENGEIKAHFLSINELQTYKEDIEFVSDRLLALLKYIENKNFHNSGQ